MCERECESVCVCVCNLFFCCCCFCLLYETLIKSNFHFTVDDRVIARIFYDFVAADFEGLVVGAQQKEL